MESLVSEKTDIEEKEQIHLLNIYHKNIKLNIGKNLNLYFDENMSNASLSPIIPIHKIDFLFQLYNLNISKETLSNKITKIIGEENLKKEKTYILNGSKIKKFNNKINIVDEHFINDCLILSKGNKDGAYIVADRISKTLFGDLISYKYITNKENNKKKVLAYLKAKENFYIESDLVENDSEAKLNVNKKIIIKYIPEKYSKEIINNINETIKKEEKEKCRKKARYEKYLQEFGGDRNLLKNKRRITMEEFSRRLPYFNMLEKDKKLKYINTEKSLIDELDNDDEEFFMNTEDLPINEILLGDLGIVDNHLKDFKYTPLKLFEMVRDSEKTRGVDFKIEYSQINDKNYCHNNEVTIFSQKLGIKVQGYGKSREEAENKCALNLLTTLFKSKFRTFYELHEYFENKNKRYLDIILYNEDDTEKNNTDLNNINNINSNKRKKIEEDTINTNLNIDNEINSKKQITINHNFDINNYNDNYSDKDNNIEDNNDNDNDDDEENINDISNNNSLSESHESLENFNSNINSNINNNGNGIGDFFDNNSNNNSHSNGISIINNSFSSNNSMTNNNIIEETNKPKNSIKILTHAVGRNTKSGLKTNQIHQS